MPYLTPDSGDLIAPLMCRQIEASGELFFYISGALAELEKEHNWEQFGTATPSEMADYFKDINDNYINSVCGGSSGMQSISGITVNLFGDYSFTGNITRSITHASLPQDAQQATAIYVNMTLNSTLGQSAYIYVTDGAHARQFFRPVGTQDIVYSFLCPMSNGASVFRAFPSGGTMSWTCNLIGWL